MDVLFFLKERTKFIRYFYETAGQPFRETMRRIEAEEPPFDDPPYSEDGEPPYLGEWVEANEGLEVLGRSCISMLSPSLQLYFRTWERELGIVWEKGERERAFNSGFLKGYQVCFGEVLGLSWDECPADLDLIEQIALARNRDQHPESITSMRVDHSPKDLQKHPRPFFASDIERKMNADPEIEGGFFMSPAVHVSREALYRAIEEVEALAEWLDARIVAARYRRHD